jgi:hypothetical protein
MTPTANSGPVRTHRPPAHVVSNALTVAVDQGAEATRRALRGLDLAAPALRALRELGLGDHVALRPGGLSWRQPGGSGTIEADVEILVKPASEDSSWLSINTRFSATEEDARVRLLDAWALIGPLASSLADRAARSVKEYAERDEFQRDEWSDVELRAA